MKVRAYLPEFSAVLAIRPWEIGLLRVDEFDRLCDWLDQQRQLQRGDVGG
jgi:hypothetical protein